MDKALIEDTEHWHNLVPPLAPNEEEVSLFQELVSEYHPVYLLGMTKQLVPLSDVAVDLNPIEIGKPTVKGDWNDLGNISAGAMIGDGILNLTGLYLVEKLLTHCERLVCRVFLKPFPEMKYATFFPQQFYSTTCIIPTQQDIVIVVWDKSNFL